MNRETIDYWMHYFHDNGIYSIDFGDGYDDLLKDLEQERLENPFRLMALIDTALMT